MVASLGSSPSFSGRVCRYIIILLPRILLWETERSILPFGNLSLRGVPVRRSKFERMQVLLNLVTGMAWS